MADETLEKLFANAKGRGKQRTKKAEGQVVSWEWASGRLPGRSLQPFAEQLVGAHGKRHKKPPAKPKHGTWAYGLDASGRVVIARSYFTHTAYTEQQYTYEEDGCHWVSYRHDGALMGVGRAVSDQGRITRLVGRDWQGKESETRIEYANERVSRVEQQSQLTGGTHAWTLEPVWGADGELDQIVRRSGTKQVKEVVYQRKK